MTNSWPTVYFWEFDVKWKVGFLRLQSAGRISAAPTYSFSVAAQSKNAPKAVPRSSSFSFAVLAKACSMTEVEKREHSREDNNLEKVTFVLDPRIPVTGYRLLLFSR